MGVSRSTYYFHLNYEPQPRKGGGGRPIPGYSYTEDGEKVSDEQVKDWIMEAIADEGAAYGYLKLTYLLRQDYRLVINKKKVYRLCKELDVLKPQRHIKERHPRRLAINRSVTEPNQLWEVDLKYGYIAGEDRFFFILSYIDVFTRQIKGYHIGLTCEAKHVVQTLKQALLKQNLFAEGKELPAIRSDNGPQFVSHLFESTCEQLDITHERIPPRTPNMNAHIESFHRLLEDDRLSRNEFVTYAEAYATVVDYMEFYNKRRLHSSLYYLSPDEFTKRHYENGLQPRKEVKV